MADQELPADSQKLPKGHLASVGMRVVLNGGKREMNSATVPFEWRFSDETIAKGPTCLLFLEQNEDEIGDRFYSNALGRRYACDVEIGTQFMQIFKPGRHRVAVLAFGKGQEKNIPNMLRSDCFVNFTDMVNGSAGGSGVIGCLAYCVVEFIVPKALFAEEPETAWQKMVWAWCSMWFKSKPRDECSYRKREIFGLVQIPLVLIFGTLNSLVVFFASLIVLLFGFRPLPVFKEMKDAFLCLRNPFKPYRRYDRGSYRVWREESHKDNKMMPVTGIEVFGIFALIGAIVSLLTCGGEIVLVVISILICFVLLAIPVILIGNRFVKFLSRYGFFESYVENREAKRVARRKEREEKLEREIAEGEARYREWLKENYGLDTLPDEVDLWSVPWARGFRKRAAQIFYIGFWYMKVEVCKPFSK